VGSSVHELDNTDSFQLLKSVYLLLKTTINYEARIGMGHKHAWDGEHEICIESCLDSMKGRSSWEIII
jgi:hypothetical protein